MRGVNMIEVHYMIYENKTIKPIKNWKKGGVGRR
jgi:hypothetical protein